MKCFKFGLCSGLWESAMVFFVRRFEDDAANTASLTEPLLFAGSLVRPHILITQTTGAMSNWYGEMQVFRPDETLVRTVGQQQGMECPWYITVDREGNILVSDCKKHSVYVYNEDGQFLFQFESGGSGEGQLKFPCGICTDRAGNIIVADSGNSRVEMFDMTGKFLKHIATGMEGPRAVAMAIQRQLVITDDK